MQRLNSMSFPTRLKASAPEWGSCDRLQSVGSHGIMAGAHILGGRMEPSD